MTNRRSFVMSTAALGASSIAATSGKPALANSDTTNTETANTATVDVQLPALRYCLNTSTIRSGGKPLPVREQLSVASQSGYDGVELWLRDIQQFQSAGGKLSDLRQEMDDLGLTLDSAIAFAEFHAIIIQSTRRHQRIEISDAVFRIQEKL